MGIWKSGQTFVRLLRNKFMFIPALFVAGILLFLVLNKPSVQSMVALKQVTPTTQTMSDQKLTAKGITLTTRITSEKQGAGDVKKFNSGDDVRVTVELKNSSEQQSRFLTIKTGLKTGNFLYMRNFQGLSGTTSENGIAGTQTYNNDNQLTAKGSRTFTYDNQGNQITDGSKALTFDFDNKLKTWNSSSPSMALAYTYDGAGNRIGKAGGGATRQYANSTAAGLSRVLVDKNVTNSAQTYYLYGDGLLSQGGTTVNTRQYYLNDGLGNVRYVTDNTGTSILAYTYDPYGNETATSILSNYGFQNYEKDRENNLTYLHARYYDPTTGRFISRDPLQGMLNLPESRNGYSYAHNDPVNLSDPSGMTPDNACDQNDPSKPVGDMAIDLGYAKRIPPQKAPFNSHGQPVFQKGNRYITPDIDAHNGGVWKMYEIRGGNPIRVGTYDANLNRIGN